MKEKIFSVLLLHPLTSYFYFISLLFYSRYERKEGDEGVVVSASSPTSLSPGKKSSGISRYPIDFLALPLGCTLQIQITVKSRAGTRLG